MSKLKFNDTDFLEPIIVESKGTDNFISEPHQDKAWDDLDDFFGKKQHKAGFVVIPTGGGKTTIASRWLLKNHLQGKGKKVLWFAHTTLLLKQGLDDFVRYQALLGKGSELQLSLVYTGGQKWSQAIDKGNDVIFSTFQSAVMASNAKYIDTFMNQWSNDLFVVIDEAHRAAAPQYSKLMLRMKEKNIPIIGLTATPMRMSEDDAKRLWKLFDHKIITSAKKSDLIARGVLAEINTETIETKIEIEKALSQNNETLLNEFGDLSKYAYDRLKQSASRNKAIVKHYKDNITKYGKTIVFAIDTYHTLSLKKEFEKAGISAEYIDYTNTGKASGIIEKYKKGKDSDPQVLINVQMLTTGFDAPLTKTVFLTRPTKSETLVQQMIGRAMRGEKFGGNVIAYLVSFVDTWSKFSPLDPNIVIHSEDVAIDIEDITSGRYKKQIIEEEIILAAYELLRLSYSSTVTKTFSIVPAKWYTWEVAVESVSAGEYSVTKRVLVFDNQLDGYSAMLKEKESILNSMAKGKLTEDIASTILTKYFSDSVSPKPLLGDILDILTALGQKKEIAEFSFEERKAFDPFKLATEMQKMTDDEQEAFLAKVMAENSLCRQLFQNDITLFQRDVFEAKMRIKRQKKAIDSIETYTKAKTKFLTLEAWPASEKGYELPLLKSNVTNHNKLPELTEYVSNFQYTQKTVKQYFGYYDYLTKEVKVNVLLNSPTIPMIVIEFILYHEILHALMPNSGHNSDFRRREAEFIASKTAINDAISKELVDSKFTGNWAAICDSFLDTLSYKYEIEDKYDAI